MSDNLRVIPENVSPKIDCLIDAYVGTIRTLGPDFLTKVKDHFDIVHIDGAKMLFAKIEHLRDIGWNIPSDVKDIRVEYNQYVETAIGLDKMRIDWHTEMMNKLITYYGNKNC